MKLCFSLNAFVAVVLSGDRTFGTAFQNRQRNLPWENAPPPRIA
jgi:hypothetical protein